MIIHAHVKDYELHIEKDFVFINKLILDEGFFVIDKNVWKLYENVFSSIPPDKIFFIDAIETKKTIDTALEICEKMTSLPSKRNTILLSFGGGIVQDITGFVANILYRGIKWFFVPTTLLASCDSCIGGKTSLNYKSYKNLLGTFYPPDEIYICPLFFKTLNEIDYMSGLGEVLKFNIMSGKKGLSNIEKKIDSILLRDEETINCFVETSLLFKKSFIEEDEFDKGKRVLLNFAHTFGHALEVTSNYQIPHGTAVALGMLIANRISLERGLLEGNYVDDIEKVIVRIIKLPLNISWFDWEKMIPIIRKDKKQTSTDLTCVLIDNNLSLSVHKDLREDELKSAVEYVKTIIINNMISDK